MKIRPLLMVIVALGAGAADVRSESFRTDINPALLYYQAFLLTPTAPSLEPGDSDYLFTNNWQGLQLPERVGTLLAKYDDQFALVRQAAQCTVPCDWGIDLSSGSETSLPQLARAKAVAVTTRLRVMWHLENGRQAQACDELLAAFALARNLPRDGTLISVLVQLASEAILCSTIAADFGQFTPESLQRLAGGWRTGYEREGPLARAYPRVPWLPRRSGRAHRRGFEVGHGSARFRDRPRGILPSACGGSGAFDPTGVRGESLV